VQPHACLASILVAFWSHRRLLPKPGGEVMPEMSEKALNDVAGLIMFEVLGRPEPAGSKRAFPNPRTGRMIVTDANPRAKPWQACVAAAAREAMSERPLLTGALKVLNRPGFDGGSGVL
jgi:hypothetical protein